MNTGKWRYMSVFWSVALSMSFWFPQWLYTGTHACSQSRPLNVEYLMMDANILLSPTMTPLTGIDFNKRLPCGEVERARRVSLQMQLTGFYKKNNLAWWNISINVCVFQAIRVFFMLRDLSLTLRQEPESQLPLTRHEECVKITDVLDLSEFLVHSFVSLNFFACFVAVLALTVCFFQTTATW